MHSSSYAREIGMDPDIRLVPWPVACALFAVLAVVLWFGARSLHSKVDARLAAEQVLPAAAEKPARRGVATK